MCKVSHPAMSVYKGYGWPKGAEDLVSSFGIKNALFSINASYVKDDVFGKLIPCPVQVICIIFILLRFFCERLKMNKRVRFLCTVPFVIQDYSS